ncbi:MAG: hypothetical protein M3O22_02485 [Pseudomonadota bacterium]|nr:hypothetical protein [Pseudomonadota bacterium]
MTRRKKKNPCISRYMPGLLWSFSMALLTETSREIRTAVSDYRRKGAGMNPGNLGTLEWFIACTWDNALRRHTLSEEGRTASSPPGDTGR